MPKEDSVRKTLIGGFLVVALLVGALSCAPAPVAEFSGGPRIFFDEDSVDMGKVPPEPPVGYTFHFRNVGDKPLVILDASLRLVLGCCPPTPVVGSRTLQPGGESTLTIPEHHMEGRHIFEITVKSNDPVEPEKKIYFKFEIVLEE